jgi:hypothetical protein
LIDQRLAQAHQRAQLEDLRRRDPRLGQLAGEEQPQLQITISAVGLRAPLAPAAGRSLGRVGEMCAVADVLDFLEHEAPAGRAFDRKLGLTIGELPQPGTHLRPRRRRDPTAAHLTRLPVKSLVRDLASMHIQRHYDPHRDLLELRR